MDELLGFEFVEQPDALRGVDPERVPKALLSERARPQLEQRPQMALLQADRGQGVGELLSGPSPELRQQDSSRRTGLGFGARLRRFGEIHQ